jgi:hypothetical protein
VWNAHLFTPDVVTVLNLTSLLKVSKKRAKEMVYQFYIGINNKLDRVFYLPIHLKKNHVAVLYFSYKNLVINKLQQIG